MSYNVCTIIAKVEELEKKAYTVYSNNKQLVHGNNEYSESQELIINNLNQLIIGALNTILEK